MASVNKESLREEFGALKERFGRLCTDGKVSAESRALFEALLMLLQVLMAVFMEKNTPKNSTNSSKPASRSPKDDTALNRPGTHGKGKELTESRSANTRTVESYEAVSYTHLAADSLQEDPLLPGQTLRAETTAAARRRASRSGRAHCAEATRRRGIDRTIGAGQRGDRTRGGIQPSRCDP